MLNDSSAVEREETPHTNSTQQNGFRVNRRIGIAFRRRAQAVIRDRSIDAQSRALIRYALEGNDPWLAELVRRVDAGESLVDSLDLSQEPHTSNDDDLEVEKIEALAEMICGGVMNPTRNQRRYSF